MKSQEIHDFEFCHILAMRASSVIPGKLLTILKWFAEKKYLGSRRAPRASTKTPKVQNTQYIHITMVKYVQNNKKSHDFENYTFWLWELHLWSQENFLQFSNDLPRKNIWDVAEHLVLVTKHQKSKTLKYIHITMVKYVQNNKKSHDFEKFTFWLWELHLWSQENFWQFSNDLPRKNIWDLAEHLVLVPKHQKSRNVQYMNRTKAKYHEIARKCTILNFVTFWLWELHLWSQENFLQFSNDLPRKNIWDVAKHLVLVTKHQKSKTLNIYT